MSSYRSYAPWKSNISSSYKTGSPSSYSSRDDVSSSRYSSLATPTTYRPSFSGGTYRIKRDAVPTRTTTNIEPYISRYNTSNTSTPTVLSTNVKDHNSDSTAKASQIKRLTTPTTNRYGRCSREPSPVAIELTNRIKSREPSPVPTRPLRGRSRDPSPATDAKCKIGYGGMNSYRMSIPRSSNTTGAYSNRYNGNSTTAMPTTRLTTNSMLDKSISYLTASDARARSISRATTRKSSEQDSDTQSNSEKGNMGKNDTNGIEEQTATVLPEDTETFYTVSVVTRATSPTPPGSTISQRTRRLDIAKTIEKTIQRSTKKKTVHEKEIQSDRMDDSTRYSRFGLNTRLSNYSPHSEGRYSAGNSRYSASPGSTSTKSSAAISPASDSKKEETSSSSKSSNKPAGKSKLSPPKAVRTNLRQPSVENLSATTSNKPPTVPQKSESPNKSTSNSASSSVKWPNKDFRKTTLTACSTDTSKKSRTPSSGTDSDALIQTANFAQSTQGAMSHERSPSASSEVSNISGKTKRRQVNNDSKLQQRYKSKNGSNTTLNHLQINGNASPKSHCHKSCAPVSNLSSGSSGTDSGPDNQKTFKKHTKSKVLSNVNANTAYFSLNANKQSAGKYADETAMRLNGSAENSSTIQQPLAARENVSQLLSEQRKTQKTPQEKSSYRLQRLSSVSNFFTARNNDADNEPIFFESSESSGDLEAAISIAENSLTADLKTNTSPAATKTNANTAKYTSTTTSTNKSNANITTRIHSPGYTSPHDFYAKHESSEDISVRNPPCTPRSQLESNSITHTGNQDTDSLKSKHQLGSDLPTETLSTFTGTGTSSTEPEEPSWWQDTSRQINTASVLDYNHKDGMRLQLRHIDSGETAWWLRNDDDDTLADDNIKTLNQEDEATDAMDDATSSGKNGTNAAKRSWWTDEINDDEEETRNENDQNETNCYRSKSVDISLKPLENAARASVAQRTDEVWEPKVIARSRYTPEQQWWTEVNDSSEHKDSCDNLKSNSGKYLQNSTVKLNISRVESGEKAWWLQDDAEACAEKYEPYRDGGASCEVTIKLPSPRDASAENSANSTSANAGKSENKSDKWWMASAPTKLFNVRRVESGEKPWWQQEDTNEQVEEKQKTKVYQSNGIKLKRNDSDEKPWWLQDQDAPEAETVQNNQQSDSENDSDNDDNDNNDDDNENNVNVKNSCNDVLSENDDAEIQHIINCNGNNQYTTNNSRDLQTELSNSFNFEYSERPPPLGQCASPVDLEQSALSMHPKCSSPYDNIPTTKRQNNNNSSSKQYQQQQLPEHSYYIKPINNSKNNNNANNKNNNNNAYKYIHKQPQQTREKLFISRHQNIDELLGGSCRPLSPLFFEGSSTTSSISVTAKPQTISYPPKYAIPPPSGRNLFLEEVTPDQVRIHDSTAQMPVIQRMERDDCHSQETYKLESENSAKRYENGLIDDAAIQVYKDGDYGAYLDLESSLAEQAEDIEGLNSSRKNSLVVRTQLSVRVHAIIEKLLSAEGSDLRRALFSLKQVFQEDKDLVHAFVALGGLNCLVSVGNGADQNYQNYILRALGQVMLYVDGMNGVMKHEPTMQWLYTLISSNYRSVVKTALKLLLVFVEYAESNCYVLVNAIHAVDNAQGSLPWSHIMRLLKDYDNADAELVIYATSLINKTLAGLNDQDSFYDESDLLEQQGMETVIQRYMSKPGTDLDLLDQLQLYEAVLKFEDGETEGIRLPDNSVRKTQRFRAGTDAAERRKSRRHSTGTSPSVMKKVLPSPKRLTPKHGVLDEDSSGSTNSTELSGGVFNEKKAARDGAGVTPGLRRRRERAERHKSFLKEQQEAANSIFATLEKREEIGQIVTAIPATVKTIESPPESLVLINENMLKTTTTTSTPATTATTNTTNSSNVNSMPATVTVDANTNKQNNGNNLSVMLSPVKQNNIHNIKNTNNNNSLLSPTRQLMLGSNTISIINNSFDKTNNNNTNNKLQNQSSPEFLTKKNLLMERNATVINGIMKNIQRSQDSPPLENLCEQNAYRKFENDANRLNNYYNQLNSTPKHQMPASPNKRQQPPPQQQQQQQQQQTVTMPQSPVHACVPQNVNMQAAQSVLSAVLSPKKTLNNFDFTTNNNNNNSSSSSKTSPSRQLYHQDESYHTNEDVLMKTAGILNTPITNSTTTQIPMFVDNFLANQCTAIPPPPPPPPPPPTDLFSYRPFPIQIQNEKNEQKRLTAVAATAPLQDKSLSIVESENEDKKLLLQLKRDHTVKDLTQKLSNLPMSPTHDEKIQNRVVGDMSGLISKAKEGLAKSKSKGEMSRSSSIDQPELRKSEPKKSENELHWEELVRNMMRPLNLCDLDFTDLNSDDEKDVLAPRGLGAGVPPPPPPLGVAPPPLMPMNQSNMMLPPPMFSYSSYSNPSLTNSFNSSMNGSTNGDLSNTNTIRKNKKTVKLFWKEVREDMIPIVVGKTIWDELPSMNVDTQKLEHLFESRAKDLMTKKQQEMNKSKEIIVLDHKRSNAINIAMTKLPPPRAIKAAILKMDATVVTREGIDKLLNMLPTDEERGKIQEAQMSNPELPLGSAEQFLLTLASISELAARLKLWAFRLDFDNSEKEIAEPLMDLKQGIEILRNNRTFRCILSTLLSVGIFLNGAPVKGFQIEYLAKVPEVKDTVHKHSLLHHLCHMVMESGTDTTDLYSEIGPITRASKADFTDLAYNLNQLETECKSSWDRLKVIAKHDCPSQLKQKLVDFLADCAERIIILQIVHRRVINRYRKFLLWLGMPQHSVGESKPNEFCRIVSEFALEYRTTRERVQQQIEKKANHRERNKTRGKLIIDMAKFKTKEDRADAELKELLGTPSADHADGTLTWRRRRAEQLRSPISRQSEENFTDGDDEILESLVKTATKAPGTRTTPRERKRTRHADRKSLRRTLKNGLTEEEKQHVAALIKTY